MKAKITHLKNYTFESEIRTHKFLMDIDALGGEDKGASPKEILLSSILGCTGMDVVALLKKYKFPFDTFSVQAQAETGKEHPKVFLQVDIQYEITGKQIDPTKVKEAVELSMTKYCGVSAMIAKSCPLYYTVVINGKIDHRSQAQF